MGLVRLLLSEMPNWPPRETGRKPAPVVTDYSFPWANSPAGGPSIWAERKWPNRQQIAVRPFGRCFRSEGLEAMFPCQFGNGEERRGILMTGEWCAKVSDRLGHGVNEDAIADIHAP